jgi:hypothetical protein
LTLVLILFSCRNERDEREASVPLGEKPGDDCYYVRDANGVRLAAVYCRDDRRKYSFGDQHLTSDEARRIAIAIARIPEFLKTLPHFVPRRVETRGKYWKASHPYHVALDEAYLSELPLQRRAVRSDR